MQAVKRLFRSGRELVLSIYNLEGIFKETSLFHPQSHSVKKLVFPLYRLGYWPRRVKNLPRPWIHLWWTGVWSQGYNVENLFWAFVFCYTALFRTTFLVIKCQTQFSTCPTKRTLLLERIHVYVWRLYLLLSFWRDNQSFKNIFKILKQPETGKTYKYNRENVFPPQSPWQ